MKKFTVLNIFSILFIAGCVIYTLLNWAVLSHGEGWGIVGMIVLISCGLAGLLIDLVLLKVFKNKWVLNVVELIIILLFSIEMWISLKS